MSATTRCGWLVILAACGRFGFPSAADAPNKDAAAANADTSVAADAPASVVAMFEAESGAITPTFEIRGDALAHGGAYVLDTAPSGTTGPGQASYPFTTTTSGTYFIYARTVAIAMSKDTFFVSIDGAADVTYISSACMLSPDWLWGGGVCSGGPVGFVLAPGAHTLVFKSREGGAEIDRIIVSSDPAFDAKD